MRAGMVLACAASPREVRLARNLGFENVVHVGVGCWRAVPEGRKFSFGYGGSSALALGSVVDAYKVVDTKGRTLWEEEPCGLVRGAKPGVIVAVDHVVCDPNERRDMCELGDIFDMETGRLAQMKGFMGAIRFVTDNSGKKLPGVLAFAQRKSGRAKVSRVVYAFIKEPRRSFQTWTNIREAEQAIRDLVLA